MGTGAGEARRDRAWPIDGGAIAPLIRAYDWASTPLGPLSGWPQSLRTAIDICLAWPEPTTILWGDDLIQIYNEPYTRAPRVQHPAMFGRPLLENWPAERDLLARALGKLRADGEALVSTDHAVTIAGADGPEVRTFTFTFAPIRDESGAIGGILHRAVETTERTRAEAALRESEQRFRIMADTVPELIWLTDANGRTEFLNKRWFEYAGASDEPSNAAQIAADFVHPDDAPAVITAFDEARRRGEPFEVEQRNRAVTGEYRWFLNRAAPYRDPRTGAITRWIGVGIDIHDRKLAEAALRESEEQYRTLFDSIDEGFCTIKVLFDETGKAVDYLFLEANPAFVRQTGLGNAIGKTMRTLAPGHEAFWFEVYGRVARTGEALRFEHKAAALDRFYDVYAFRIGAAQENRVAVLFNDITERKRREANLTFLAEVSQDLARLRNIDETMGALGEKIAAHFGLSLCVFVEIDEAAEIGTVSHGWHRADVPKVSGAYRIGDFVAPEFQRMSRDGEIVVVRDALANPLVDTERFAALKIGSFVTVPLVREGEWRFCLGAYHSEAHDWRADEIELLRELTRRIWSRLERARAEAALRESEALFRQFGAASADLLWVRDAATLRFAYLSPAFTAFYGVDPARVQGSDDLAAWAALIHPDDRARVLADLERVRSGERVAHEFRVIHPDHGEEHWLRDAVFPLLDAAGRVQRIGGITRDITDRKRAVAERERLLAAERAARAEAEEAVRARDTFLSIAAHELRTPLTALKGTTQLLRRRQSGGTLGTERLATGLATLDQSADRLVALTADLLDVARIRTGQLPLIPHPTDLVDLVAEAVATVRDRAGGAHRLDLDAPAALPPVRADTGRIEQVLTNVLDNAIKYSPTGGRVAVTVRAEGAGVAVAVSDEGIGLPPDATEAIFTPFGRAANAAASRLPGMGLGLFICRSIVERHEGWIRATSDGEDRGTTVTFWLPSAGPTAAAEW